MEALTRRAGSALHRINRLTDLYNAVSVLHQLPVGGDAVVDHPDVGEVVWCDDAGVTCRRWNWRQARRTQLTEDTTTETHLCGLGPDVHIVRRLLSNSQPPGP